MATFGSSYNYELDPFTRYAQSYYSRILSPDYQYYTDEDINRMFQQQKTALTEDVFKPLEARTAARLANQGIGGSGVAQLSWYDKVTNPEKRILSDVHSNLLSENRAATRQMQSQAFGMTPSLSSTYYTPQELWLQKYGIEKGAEAAAQQAKAQKSSAKGSLLGKIIGGLLSKT